MSTPRCSRCDGLVPGAGGSGIVCNIPDCPQRRGPDNALLGGPSEPQDDEVPDDFRPTNLEMLGETGCPGCDALVVKFKEMAQMLVEVTEDERPFDNISRKADIIKELGKTSRWLLEEAKDES